ncbi:response regulator transcription factor [Paenibacillus koleovorans]|uniref:response regulator transcription factor n=1 Tax=Paenibacillus koleovorans TaxID=121608 RepID=UPI000FDC52C7|nr:response regulator [Paenibacillus koleovorans]
MYKVIIVDDEMLVRIGMTSLIRWEDYGFEVVATASDGLQARELIERHMPDIVLTDIVMPGLNGLELIAEIRRKYAFIRFIVLSSHSDYMYVREAMKLDAEDYILKASIKPAELIRLLQTTADKLEQRAVPQATGQPAELALNGEQLKRTMLRLVCGEPVDESERDAWFGQKDEPGDEWAVLYIKLHGPEEAAWIGLESALLHLAEVYGPGRCRHVLEYKSGEFMALIVLAQATSPEGAGRINVEPLLHAVRRFLNMEGSVGLSDCFASSAEFKTAFLQAKEAVQYAFYHGLGKGYRYEPSFFAHGDQVLFDKKDAEELERCADTGQLAGLELLKESLFERLSASKCYRNQDISMFMEILHAVKRVAARHGISWDHVYADTVPIHIELLRKETIEEMKAWFGSLFGSFVEQLAKAGREKYRVEVSQLIGYMRAHYTENLTLNDAAGIVNMSPSYLSSLFKRETGKSFIELLTEIRMDKAAELLLRTDLPVYLIAEQVGYDNINYFGRAFKKEKSVSPSQYRTSQQGAKN